MYNKGDRREEESDRTVYNKGDRREEESDRTAANGALTRLSLVVIHAPTPVGNLCTLDQGTLC